MNQWPALERFLSTDPRDVGCAQAMELLHVYADLIAGHSPARAAQRYRSAGRFGCSGWRIERTGGHEFDSCSVSVAKLERIHDRKRVTSFARARDVSVFYRLLQHCE